MMKPDWVWVAPRLASLYQRGLLVPFIGAGLSRPACPGWGDFITRLETFAATGTGTGGDPSSLVRRANRTVLALRHRGQGVLEKAVREALISLPVTIPESTKCLADIWWPLVVTTNYDNLYPASVFARWKTRPLVLGRSPMHCFQVGRVLREPLAPALWAIQGYMDTPCVDKFDPQNQLASELVVGHEEYRRVTHREPHFRRAFAEVYRNRSLLFVGSGLQEQYLLDLFSEIREFYGPNGHLHFAFAPEGELDVDFLLREFQIAVVEYVVPRDNPANHTERHRYLRDLRCAIDVAPSPSRWDFHVPSPKSSGSACFSVEQSRLPASLEEGGCIAVSAGGNLDHGPLFFSPTIQQFVADYAPNEPHRKLKGEHVARLGEHPLFAVIARERGSSAREFKFEGSRTLAAVYWATRNLLTHVQQAGFTTLHAQLFASGPVLDDDNGMPPFRPIHALAEMASAFGDFVRARALPTAFHMAVHVVDPSVYAELRRGRLFLPEFLGCEDLRIWVAIEMEGRPPSYHHLHIPALEFSGASSLSPGAPVRLNDVAQMFHIPKDWTVDIWPSPQRGWAPGILANVGHKEVVFAAVAGSTVRFIGPGGSRD